MFTNDDDIALALRQIARHGQDRRYHHVRVGMNSRLDTLQAAIILQKLTIFDEEISLRQQVADLYEEKLSGLGLLSLPYIEEHSTSVYAQYTVRVADRPSVQETLKAEGIPSVVHYPIPLNKQPAVADESVFLNVGDEVASQVLSLPMHPYLTEQEINLVAAALEKC